MTRMTPAESDEGFRVTDRRRRIDAEEAPAPPPSPPPSKVEPARTERARPGPSTVEAPRPTSPPPASAPGGPAAAERSLAGLFVMLAGSAAMAMGEAPDPLTGQVQRDLDQAADVIDLLLLLREKTEGNRTPEEAQILDEILYDLQLRYVSATKQSAPPRGPSRR